jgi:hypothetical protein
MKGCEDALITKPLLLDVHKSEDMFEQHLMEHLLEAK